MLEDVNLSISENYDLYQAYFLLGFRMIGSSWRPDHSLIHGQEINDIEEQKVQNETLKQEYKELDEETRVFWKRQKKEGDTERRQLYDKLIAENNEKMTKLRKEIKEPHYFEGLIRDREAYLNHTLVEKELIENIKNNSFGVSAIGGYSHDKSPWNKERGCSYNIALSCIYWSQKHFNEPSQQLIHLNKDSFDEWLDKKHPWTEEFNAMLDKVEQAKKWFNSQLKKPTKQTKNYYIDHMVDKMEISNKQALAIWDQFAHSSMKKPGRPSTSKS